MILDSSALVAVLFEEPGYQELEHKMLGPRLLAVGAPTLVETEMVVVGRYGKAATIRSLDFARAWTSS